MLPLRKSANSAKHRSRSLAAARRFSRGIFFATDADRLRTAVPRRAVYIYNQDNNKKRKKDDVPSLS